MVRLTVLNCTYTSLCYFIYTHTCTQTCTPSHIKLHTQHYTLLFSVCTSLICHYMPSFSTSILYYICFILKSTLNTKWTRYLQSWNVDTHSTLNRMPIGFNTCSKLNVPLKMYSYASYILKSGYHYVCPPMQKVGIIRQITKLR